jgi:hypothetical protein
VGKNDGSIAVFCHIPKTGGMTFVHLLRQYFGLCHLEVEPVRGWAYQAADLQRDLRWQPWLRSLGGHSCRPYVDFGPQADRLRWYTILRDPIARSISNYQHQVEKMGIAWSFTEWMKRPENHNWHVRMLAGEQDLTAAKQILTDKIECFGFIERYNEFLLLLRETLGWGGFRVAYAKARNPAKKGQVRHRIQQEFENFREDLHATNELDLALYDYAAEHLYPKLVERYGVERLQQDLTTEFLDPRPTAAERWRRYQNTAYRRLLYLSVLKVMKARRRSASR